MRLSILRENPTKSFNLAFIFLIFIALFLILIVLCIDLYKLNQEYQDFIDYNNLTFNPGNIHINLYKPGGKYSFKNHVLDSMEVTEKYLFSTIQPDNLQDSIILYSVIFADKHWTPSWVLTQIYTESRFIPSAISRDSLNNPICYGLMQIHPKTALLMNRNPARLLEVRYNIETGLICLKHLYKTYNSEVQALGGYATGRASDPFGQKYKNINDYRLLHLKWLELIIKQRYPYL